jgi:dienelactone hydrolase
MKTVSLALVLTVLTVSPALGKIVTEIVPYRHGDTELEGCLAYDDAAGGKRPGVLVVHEWWGLNDFAKQQARRLAELGYVAFAVDMYGKGQVTTDPEQAGKWAGQFRENTELLRARAKAAYDTLAANPRVDAARLGAIGFCFGGTTVLQMAAAGLDLAGVVSFHGGLPAISDADAARIRAKVLILHGAADTHVPEASVKALTEALNKAHVDWQMMTYSGAKHSFTNPASDKMNAPGVGYDAAAARRSWAHMRLFFDEVLAGRT